MLIRVENNKRITYSYISDKAVLKLKSYFGLHDIIDMASLLGNSGTWGFDEAFSLAKFKIWTRICIYMELGLLSFLCIICLLLQVLVLQHKNFFIMTFVYINSFDGIHKSWKIFPAAFMISSFVKKNFSQHSLIHISRFFPIFRQLFLLLLGRKKFKFYAKIFLPFQHQIGRWTCHLVKRFSIQRTHRIYFQVIVDANMTKCMSTGRIDWLNKWLETYLAHQIFVHFTWNKIVFIRINFFTYSGRGRVLTGLVWTNF